jgi:hypothetical protein
MKMRTLVSLTCVVMTSSLMVACSTARPTQNANSSRAISSEEGVLIRFMDSLTQESTQTDHEAIQRAFIDAINRNSDGSSTHVGSLEDIRTMSPSDQMNIVRKLSQDTTLKRFLSVSDDTANTAESRILSAQGVHAATADSAVPDIHATANVGQFAAQGADIQRISGVAVLGERCNNLQDQEALQNLKKILDGVRSDLSSGGSGRSPADVAASIEKRITEETGADKFIAHNFRCQLAEHHGTDGGCAVLAEALYVGCEE